MSSALQHDIGGFLIMKNTGGNKHDGMPQHNAAGVENVAEQAYRLFALTTVWATATKARVEIFPILLILPHTSNEEKKIKVIDAKRLIIRMAYLESLQ